jgi:DNA-binding NarL/FixJ family response regulator
MPTTVVIADDHAVTAAGISWALAEIVGFDVVGVAGNGIEAIMLIKKHRPDCAILDLTMPGANGLEVLIEGKRWSPRTRMAILTGSPSPAIFAQLVEAGIDGIFLKTSAPEDICAGMRDIANGMRVISPEIAAAVKSAGGTAGLTAREIEVLHGIARGLSNAQIGETLRVSPKTVDSHRTALMRKMGVHSSATLLVRALRDGLIDV